MPAAFPDTVIVAKTHDDAYNLLYESVEEALESGDTCTGDIVAVYTFSGLHKVVSHVVLEKIDSTKRTLSSKSKK